MSKVQTIYEKLFTHEDILNIHKTLGVLSMLSFIARVRYAGVQHDMGFKTWPNFTVATVLLHWTAVLSSLVFKIPERRIKQGNRLWPQARLHNICFCTRHLSFILLYWAEQVYGLEANFLWNYAIIMGTMIAADLVSESVKDKSNTIRDLQAHPAAKYLFSSVQFNATCFCLLGLRCSEFHLYVVFLIQLTAFMTTLRRKNLGRHEVGIFLYGLQLVLGCALNWNDIIKVGSLHVFFLFNITARVAHLLRVASPSWLGPLKSKYVLWTLAAVFLHYTRPFGPNPHPIGLWLAEDTQAFYVRMVSMVLTVATVSHGYIVTQKNLPAFRALKEA